MVFSSFLFFHSRQTLLVILVVAKLLRTASLYTSYGYLRLLNYPSTVWAWFLLFGASIIFLIVQQPWKGRFIQPQLVRYSFYDKINIYFSVYLLYLVD